MAALSEDEIQRALEPYLHGALTPVHFYRQLGVYLELLVKWNARTNLTSIRSPEEIVRRHFGESLFLAAHLPSCLTFLDYGSGAGFPGLPVKLYLPDLAVTLAESQGKKAAFLREAVRTLGVEVEVWADRVEAMPQGRVFDVVALRAVDEIERAMEGAGRRVAPHGTLALLTVQPGAELRIPESTHRALVMIRHGEDVPRGTYLQKSDSGG